MFTYQWNLQFPLIAVRISHYKNSAIATTYKHSELDKSELKKNTPLKNAMLWPKKNPVILSFFL